VGVKELAQSSRSGYQGRCRWPMAGYTRREALDKTPSHGPSAAPGHGRNATTSSSSAWPSCVTSSPRPRASPCPPPRSGVRWRSSIRSGTCCSSQSGSASCTLHLLLESVVYDGATGELELRFYPLGITSLAAEAAMVGQATAGAAA
jgi:hypothetical protein